MARFVAKKTEEQKKLEALAKELNVSIKRVASGGVSKQDIMLEMILEQPRTKAELVKALATSDKSVDSFKTYIKQGRLGGSSDADPSRAHGIIGGKDTPYRIVEFPDGSPCFYSQEEYDGHMKDLASAVEAKK